jgi:hypothetical protein
MGIMRILDHFEMFSINNIVDEVDGSSEELGPVHTILCSRGFWVHD